MTVAAPVLVADDHPLFRAALSAALSRAAPERDIVEVNSLALVRAALEREMPALICLDLHMGDSNGFAGLLQLRAAWPDVPVAVVSGSESGDVIRRAYGFGAAAFIPKSSELGTITEAVGTVLGGDLWYPPGYSADAPAEDNAMAERLASLTPAQLKVLTGVHQGLLNKQIAYEMGISEATVKAHLTAIFRKLDVLTRTQAVLAAAALFVDQPETRSEG